MSQHFEMCERRDFSTHALRQYSVHLSINSGSTLCGYWYINTLLRMTHAY